MKREMMPIFDRPSEIIRRGTQEEMSRTQEFLDILLCVLISVLSGWGFITVFTSAFGLELSMFPFLIVVTVLSILVAFMVRGEKASSLMLLGVLAGAGLYIALNFRTVVSECAGLYVRIVTRFHEYYNMGDEVKLRIEPSFNVTIIMAAAAFVPIWQAGYAYGKRIFPTVLAVFFMLPLFLCIICGQKPSVLSLAVSGTALLILFITCYSEFMLKNHAVGEAYHYLVRRSLFFLGLIAAVILFVFVRFAVFPMQEEKIHLLEERYTEHFLNDLLARLPGNPLNLSDPGLTEGKLQNADHVIRNGKTVFTVELEQETARPVYLRGYTGDLYTGTGFMTSDEKLPETVTADTIGFADAYSGRVGAGSKLYRNPFLYYQTLFLKQYQAEETELNRITVHKSEASDDYVYAPYGVTGEITGDDFSASFEKDLYMKGSDEAAAFPFTVFRSLPETLKRAQDPAASAGKLQPDGSVTVRYLKKEDLIGLFSEQYGVSLREKDISENPNREFVIDREDGSEYHFRIREAWMDAYEQYVLNTDTASSGSALIRAAAQELMQVNGISYGLKDYQPAVHAVQQYLKANAAYSLNPGRMESGSDFVEDFLTVKKEGYCVHFAVAGTLLLREMGIPARYVEGYLIPPEPAGEEIELTDYEAHAWTEVFIPEFGWYPVEMTPPYLPEEEETETEPESSETEDGTQEPETETETAPGEETTIQPDDPEGTDQGGEKQEDPGKKLNGMLTAVLILTLVFAALLVLWTYLRKHIVPLEKLTGAGTNETLLNIYEKIRIQGRMTGRSFLIDDTAESILEQYEGVLDTETLTKMQTLAKAAFYSRNETAEADVRWLYRLYESRIFMRMVKEKERS